MSRNTKYQAAPQRDSLEEQSYPVPPPSYQEDASSEAALLAGEPRSDNDNIPDDFKVSNVRVEVFTHVFLLR